MGLDEVGDWIGVKEDEELVGDTVGVEDGVLELDSAALDTGVLETSPSCRSAMPSLLRPSHEACATQRMEATTTSRWRSREYMLTDGGCSV